MSPNEPLLPNPIINLLRGWPNKELLPASQIAASAQIALSNPSVYTPGLLYGPDPGYQPLREEIAKWLNGFYDVQAEASAERICITGGASQNLACILQVFTDPVYTKGVWMVAPCYFLACRIFEDSGFAGRLRAVPEGKEGIDLKYLEKGLDEIEDDEKEEPILKPARPWSKTYRHIIYAVPTFSNPSGSSMTLAARESLVRLSRKHNALLITDDVYDFLQWTTNISSSSPPFPKNPLTKAPLPRLIDIDRNLHPTPGPESFGNAVSNGSFSKIAGPGVRTGWAEASPRFTYGLSQCGSSRSGGAPSQMTATIICELLTSGALMRHIERVLQPTYQRRCTAMVATIRTHLLPLGVQIKSGSLFRKAAPDQPEAEAKAEGDEVFGGYFIWLELPGGIGAAEVAQRAKEEENLIVAEGAIFEVHGDPRVRFGREVRVCFSWEDEHYLEEGIVRLGRVVRRMLDGDGGGELRGDTTVSGRNWKEPLGEFQ